jgi:hypothetical protein
VRKSTSWYPLLSAEATGSGVVSQAGALALARTAQASGLSSALSVALGPWRKPLATHDPGKIITDLAISLAIGGDCLSDVAVLREQSPVFGAVASGPTVSRLITALPLMRPQHWPPSIPRERRHARRRGLLRGIAHPITRRMRSIR